jgi:nucleoside-diphosphate-sugar epimerase
MNEKLVLVGGAGYLGTRIGKELERSDIKFSVLDPCLLWPEDHRNSGWDIDLRDVTKVPQEEFRGKTVVYLASLHKHPDLKWEPVMDRLMVTTPLSLLPYVDRLIYISSMQTIHGEPSTYAAKKRRAEAQLFSSLHFQKVSVLRLGTLFGGLERGYPNRIHTVPNRYCIGRGDIPADFSSYVTDVVQSVGNVVDLITYPYKGTVRNAITGAGPVDAPRLKTLLTEYRRDDLPDLDDRHPMEVMEEYYFDKRN